jgi:hypothetical protein
VVLDAANVGIEEVANHAYSMDGHVDKKSNRNLKQGGERQQTADRRVIAYRKSGRRGHHMIADFKLDIFNLNQIA